MTVRRGLGRGLEQLIPPEPVVSEIPSGGRAVEEVPVDAIVPNPLQPRSQFDDASLREMAASIAVHGIIQPLVVEPGENGRYHLVAGERRLRAAELAGLETVPVVLRPVDEERTRLEMALVENLQRRAISPLDEARAFTQLCDEFGLTQEAVAQRLGRSRSGVANTMRLLQATPEVQRALAEERISAAHARALLAISNAGLQVRSLAQVLARHLSVRDTERLVARLTRGRSPAVPGRPGPDPELSAIEEAMARKLSTRVKIVPGARGRGRIVIEYFSAEEFAGICDLLGLGG